MIEKPKLDDMKDWTLDQVRAQYEAEQQEHRANLDKPWYQRAYHEPLSALYRLGYMRWVLNGSPQPMPRFV